MNRYGQRALNHWRQFLPEQYSQIPMPEDYFSTLGEEAETQIQDLELQLAGRDSPGEGYLEKVGRLNMARLRAEEMVMADLLPTPSEDEDEDVDSETDPGLAIVMNYQRSKQRWMDEDRAEKEERDYQDWLDWTNAGSPLDTSTSGQAPHQQQ